MIRPLSSDVLETVKSALTVIGFMVGTLASLFVSTPRVIKGMVSIYKTLKTAAELPAEVKQLDDRLDEHEADRSRHNLIEGETP